MLLLVQEGILTMDKDLVVVLVDQVLEPDQIQDFHKVGVQEWAEECKWEELHLV